MQNLFPCRIIALFLSLLVVLSSGQGLAAGVVLCVGADGCSAFEQAVAGKCTPLVQPCPAEDGCTCTDDTHDHCGPCDDFSLSAESLPGRSRGDQELASALALPALAPAPVPAPALFVRDLTANLFSLPPPDPYTALLALRTVVLLN